MTKGEAINWIINISADIGKAEHSDLWHYEQALSEIREMLESAPTAQPEPQWIPCSERLPERGNYYLVTDFGSVEDAYYGSYGWWLSRNGDKLKDVTAWMPLPEPYQEEK